MCNKEKKNPNQAPKKTPIPDQKPLKPGQEILCD